MCHLQIEGVLLSVIRHANHLHTIGIIGGPKALPYGTPHEIV